MGTMVLGEIVFTFSCHIFPESELAITNSLPEPLRTLCNKLPPPDGSTMLLRRLDATVLSLLTLSKLII